MKRTRGSPQPAPAITAARNKCRWLWPALGGIAFIAAILFFAMRNRPASVLPEMKVVVLTSYPGQQIDPALSPDGRQVAFSWNGEKEDNFDIYVKLVDAGTPLRLTRNAAD